MPQHSVEIFTPSSVVGTENVSANGAENAVETSVADYSSAIVERNIFGVADSSGAEEKSPRDNKPDRVAKSVEEELGLELLGTVCGSTEVSRALIKDTKTKLLEIYKTGQSVSGARIMSIEDNAVMLLHNGQRKILTLNRTSGQNNMRVPSSETIEETGNVVKPVLSAKQPLTQIATRIEYVEGILSKAVIEPYAVNGQVEGLKITGLESIPIAQAFGLRNGDVIRLVNGHQLTSKQKAVQVFKKARSQTAMSMEILRGDKIEELSFDLY